MCADDGDGSSCSKAVPSHQSTMWQMCYSNSSYYILYIYVYYTYIHEVLPSQCTYSVSINIMCCTQFIVLNYAPCNTVTSDGQLFTPNKPHLPAKMDHQAFIHTREYWHMHPCLAVAELNISLQYHAYHPSVLHCTPMLHSPDIQQITEHIRKLLYRESFSSLQRTPHTHMYTIHSEAKTPNHTITQRSGCI